MVKPMVKTPTKKSKTPVKPVKPAEPVEEDNQDSSSGEDQPVVKVAKTQVKTPTKPKKKTPVSSSEEDEDVEMAADVEEDNEAAKKPKVVFQKPSFERSERKVESTLKGGDVVDGRVRTVGKRGVQLDLGNGALGWCPLAFSGTYRPWENFPVDKMVQARLTSPQVPSKESDKVIEERWFCILNPTVVSSPLPPVLDYNVPAGTETLGVVSAVEETRFYIQFYNGVFVPVSVKPEKIQVGSALRVKIISTDPAARRMKIHVELPGKPKNRKRENVDPKERPAKKSKQAETEVQTEVQAETKKAPAKQTETEVQAEAKKATKKTPVKQAETKKTPAKQSKPKAQPKSE